MFWEILAIWIIVVATLIWFFRDERRIGDDRLKAQARRFATESIWRHRASGEPAPVRPYRADTVTDIQRKFAEEMRRQR